MVKHLFHIAIVLIVLVLSALPFFFKDRTEAMLAIVDSQVTALSFENPVIVTQIYVIPGQEVKKGDLLIEVQNPNLDLEIKKHQTEIDRLETEIEAKKEEFQLRKNIDKLELDQQLFRLQSDIDELQFKIGQDQSLKQGLSKLTGRKIASDTLQQTRLQEIFNQIKRLRFVYRDNQERRSQQLEKTISILESKRDLVKERILTASTDKSKLTQYAQFDGTIGTVDVQLNELVAPFKKLITIYEQRPSIIKAYMNEQVSYEVKVGQMVWVASENRDYQIEGKVMEIGSRITSFPSKLEPDLTTQSYGQEVFVSISNDSRFLNGEKVFVYPQEI